MRRYTRRPRFGGSANRPTRDWASISSAWLHSALTATAAATLVRLEQPTDLTNLSSDPPEDLTVLRIVGDFTVALGAAGTWTLALTVQDTTWTPTAGTSGWFSDSDKRMLWSMTYTSLGELLQWSPPGFLEVGGVPTMTCPREAVHIDISPKVKITSGKSLVLVAYEQSGATTFDTIGFNMRMLYQRSRRR